jgi:hypothetical protein
MTGAFRSMVIARFSVSIPTAFIAEITLVVEPLELGVPVMAPEEVLIDSPAGRLVAL